MTATATEPATDARPTRILVVDDERSMREMLAILLKREGHEVSVAENGRAAIELLNQRPFDLVVSCLAIHHLASAAKRDLFGRIAAVLAEGGTFVLADVIVPDDPADALTPCTPGYDMPDRLDDQLDWLGEARFAAEPTWVRGDLAVVRARLMSEK